MLGPSVVVIEPVAPSQLLDPVRVAAQWRGPRCAALAAAGSGKAAPGRAPGRSIIKTARKAAASKLPRGFAAAAARARDERHRRCHRRPGPRAEHRASRAVCSGSLRVIDDRKRESDSELVWDSTRSSRGDESSSKNKDAPSLGSIGALHKRGVKDRAEASNLRIVIVPLRRVKKMLIPNKVKEEQAKTPASQIALLDAWDGADHWVRLQTWRGPLGTRRTKRSIALVSDECGPTRRPVYGTYLPSSSASIRGLPVRAE